MKILEMQLAKRGTELEKARLLHVLCASLLLIARVCTQRALLALTSTSLFGPVLSPGPVPLGRG